MREGARETRLFLPLFPPSLRKHMIHQAGSSKQALRARSTRWADRRASITTMMMRGEGERAMNNFAFFREQRSDRVSRAS